MTGTFTPSFSFGIVVSRFNAEITEKLLDSCTKTLVNAGVQRSSLAVVRVPGAYEIPWAAQELALSKKFDVVICLGAILKGQTPQNDYIASSTIRHLHTISVSTRVPCILGVITPNTETQALARTKGKFDRGREAALAALEMAKLRWGMTQNIGTQPVVYG